MPTQAEKRRSLLVLQSRRDRSCRARNANAFQAHAAIESMKLDSRSEPTHLKVPKNRHLAIAVLADMGGFEAVRPEMPESTAPGSALLAASAVGLFGWDIMRPETLVDVNSARGTVCVPHTTAEERSRPWLAACCGALPWIDRDRGGVIRMIGGGGGGGE